MQGHFKNICVLLFLLLLNYQLFAAFQAQWIVSPTQTDNVGTNKWLCFKKSIVLTEKPQKALINIAADTKYWLYINGQIAIFEGGLKRGPLPSDSYFDEVNITKYLKQGNNTLAILVWHFGNNGLSHKNSGSAGLFFEADIDGIKILSDKTWKVKLHPAYYNTNPPHPNSKLAESNVAFDARNDFAGWQTENFNDANWLAAKEVGEPGTEPWGQLVKRPIPLFKTSEILPYPNATQKPLTVGIDTFNLSLPYNAQITPYLKIYAKEGQKIEIFTDSYLAGNNKEYTTVRSEYITKSGEQEYESLGWMNGHTVKYVFPANIEILSLGYRESGYNTEFTGSFESSDLFLNDLWKKSQRTLYINMRDNLMNNPDKERAQFIGDAVIEAAEAYYALDTNSHKIIKKAFNEFINWQRKDNAFFTPTPAGNYNKEIASQALACIGYYGLWSYYLNTGDKKTVLQAYQPIKKYLDLWKQNTDGLLIGRNTDINWFDTGNNIDEVLLENAWYYLALKGVASIATLANDKNYAQVCKTKMEKLKNGFNKLFWVNNQYRSPLYTGETDERGNAMAVLCGFADTLKWPLITTVLISKFNAGTYMEKYVLEALFMMNKPENAIARIKTRYAPMVNKQLTTLSENWDLNKESNNYHAYSGGPLTLMMQYMAGISVDSAGWEYFSVLPHPTSLNYILTKFQTIKGEINLKYIRSENRLRIMLTVPKGSHAQVGVPKLGDDLTYIYLGNQTIYSNKAYQNTNADVEYVGENEHYYLIKADPGNYEFEAVFK